MRIQALATHDELTALPNRRHMNEVLQREEERHRRAGRTLCVAMVDIDWFKHVNDTYGHAVGDEVLRRFAHQAREAVRAADVLARWGGEEFLLLLPDTEISEAIQVLERVRLQSAALDLTSIHPYLHITFSAGLTASRPGEPILQTIERADREMYRAKTEGRNRIVVSPA
jgi:diguanylate cyclase (GGDEF)-like protein